MRGCLIVTIVMEQSFNQMRRTIGSPHLSIKHPLGRHREIPQNHSNQPSAFTVQKFTPNLLVNLLRIF
jgi:hypothetical protein